MAPPVDVLVVGAGPAGLATAIALRQRDVGVTVLDCRAEPGQRIGESVPAEIRRPLAMLGVWDAFCRQGHLPSRGNASAWNSGTVRYVDALCSPLGGGWHLDRRAFEVMLARRAKELGAEILRSARATGTRWNRAGDHWSVTCDDRAPRKALYARLIVDATGRRAVVATQVGAHRYVHDRLLCAYAVFEGKEVAGEAGWTLVEAVEDGWWYATALPGEKALGAHFGAPRHMSSAGRCTPAAWHRALRSTRHVFGFMGRPECPSKLSSVLVTPHCLDVAGGRDWLATGDSASSLDPLASAGIALALTDGLEAAEALMRRLDGDVDALIRRGRAVQPRFMRYLSDRAGQYNLGHRWPQSEFWRARGTDTSLDDAGMSAVPFAPS